MYRDLYYSGHWQQLRMPGIDFNTAISTQDKDVFKSLIENQDIDGDHGVKVMKLFFELT